MVKKREKAKESEKNNIILTILLKCGEYDIMTIKMTVIIAELNNGKEEGGLCPSFFFYKKQLL